jgi:hypothetical protein
VVLVIFGALGAIGGLTIALRGNNSDQWTPFIVCANLLIAGIVWLRSLHPTYHLMLATAGGERQGMTSNDEGVVDRVTAAIADAIVYRAASTFPILPAAPRFRERITSDHATCGSVRG